MQTLYHTRFVQSAYKPKFNLASLPPTEDAVKQHSLRAYLQVQQWNGVKCDALNWGWQKCNEGLIPVPLLQPPAPDKLLQLIFCRCKKDCQRACGCRKAGLKCSAVCANCKGNCSNGAIIVEDDSNDNIQDNAGGIHNVQETNDIEDTIVFVEPADQEDEMSETYTTKEDVADPAPGPSRSKRPKVDEDNKIGVD